MVQEVLVGAVREDEGEEFIGGGEACDGLVVFGHQCGSFFVKECGFPYCEPGGRVSRLHYVVHFMCKNLMSTSYMLEPVITE